MSEPALDAPQQPTRRLALAVGALLLAHLPLRWVAQAAQYAISKHESQLALGVETDPDAAGTLALAGGSICCLYFPVFIALAVCFCMFVHRASSTLIDYGTERPEHTPAMSVGWFFIPFANLVMPLRVVRDLWEVSEPGEHRGRAPALVLAWWLAWISSSMLDSVGGIAGNFGAHWHLSAPFQLLITGAWIAATLLAWRLVSGLDRRVTARAAAAAEGEPAAEPAWR